MSQSLLLNAIGIARTPYLERRTAPRQAGTNGGAVAGTPGRVELFPAHGLEHALEDLQGWSHIWLIFWFHENRGWRPKVLPPRSQRRRGVFSTRSPHRPNPIGLSLVGLERVDGLTLHVRDVDMLDGTPVLDIKPYVPYADFAPNAKTGWLEPLVASTDAQSALDPEPGFSVFFSPLAGEQTEFLRRTFGLDLSAEISRALTLGPQPHPYRRIKRTNDGLTLAIKDWRARFMVEGRQVTVISLMTGYRPQQLSTEEPALEPHRAFKLKFG